MREGRKGDGEDRLLRAENARHRKQVRVVGVNRPREEGGELGERGSGWRPARGAARGQFSPPGCRGRQGPPHRLAMERRSPSTAFARVLLDSTHEGKYVEILWEERRKMSPFPCPCLRHRDPTHEAVWELPTSYFIKSVMIR